MTTSRSSTVQGVVALPRAYASRYGAPVITHVDTDMFRRTYFTHCLQCNFCHDACCQHGVDVDLYHYARIQRHADGIERYTKIPRQRWFTGEYEKDPEVPGGGSHRTLVVDGSCVFLDRESRGCLLHAYCLEEGLDHRELKSMVDCLFPLTFYDDTLCVADEVDEDELVCLDTGPTIYHGGRDELEYYFGEVFIEALDALEASVLRA